MYDGNFHSIRLITFLYRNIYLFSPSSSTWLVLRCCEEFWTSSCLSLFLAIFHSVNFAGVIFSELSSCPHRLVSTLLCMRCIYTALKVYYIVVNITECRIMKSCLPYFIVTFILFSFYSSQITAINLCFFPYYACCKHFERNSLLKYSIIYKISLLAFLMVSFHDFFLSV
jgi:hypothetical protein